jgi:NAD+ diphosphatase
MGEKLSMTPSPDPRTLSVGRPAIDRSAADRALPGLVASARADATTRVLVLAGDRAPFDEPDRLLWVSPAGAPTNALWALLGRDDDDIPLLAAIVPAQSDDPFPAPAGWGSLRRAGAVLRPHDAAAFVEALSLGRWLLDAAFCPACGSETRLEDAGWSRRCPSCGRQHFPRTDPAVIVAITSALDPDRLLLGSNALWEANRYSCFAGFVEAGESAEGAVRREVLEESGVRVASIAYRGSQPWPYPRSLMLGFFAVAEDDAQAHADGEEIRDLRWFTRDEIGAGLRGEGDLLLPGAASIAHALIRDWYEGAK